MTAPQRISVELRTSAVIQRGAEVLLMRHVRDGRSYWVLPGGHPHAHEVATAAVEREVWEETGLKVTPRHVLFVWEGIAPHDRRRIAEIVFAADLVDPSEEPRAASELEEPAFVPIEDLGTYPLYPPVAGYVRGAHQEGFRRGAPYLGNLWRSMHPLDRSGR